MPKRKDSAAHFEPILKMVLKYKGKRFLLD